MPAELPPHIADQLHACQQRFKDQFNRPATFAAVAPGRVNLIGEHVDYCDGFVLPIAIERQTLILAAPGAPGIPGRNGFIPVDGASRNRSTGESGSTIRVVSTGQTEPASFELSVALKPGQPKWANYVRGVLAGCLEAGLNPGCLDLLIDSTVPLGSGLSSSAALEVATATLVEAVTEQKLDPIRKALLCQKAEHEFAGMPCGIMDQFISVMGQADHALLLDCRTRQTRLVPLADAQLAILIANTNVKHELSGSEYPQRRAQCAEAARTLRVSSLRDLAMRELLAAKDRMDPVVFRRARHVVGEIARTMQAADEMQGGHWASVGRLMYKSHQSLRDDFEVSCPELDLLVEVAQELDLAGGVYGARMTGGGFGGCTVTLVKQVQADRIAAHLHDQYKKRTGIDPALFVTRPADGARILPIQ